MPSELGHLTRLGLLGLPLLGGCGHELGPLVDLSAFEELDAGDDPFSDRPAEVTCPPGARTVELDDQGIPSLEVDTGACDYLGLSQPLLLDVKAGDTIRMQLFHDVLLAEAPARAHCALRIGDWSVFDREEPIPTTSVTWTDELLAPQDFEAGTTVVLHLHNHGSNTWNFYDLSSVEAP